MWYNGFILELLTNFLLSLSLIHFPVTIRLKKEMRQICFQTFGDGIKTGDVLFRYSCLAIALHCSMNYYDRKMAAIMNFDYHIDSSK